MSYNRTHIKPPVKYTSNRKDAAEEKLLQTFALVVTFDPVRNSYI